MNAKELGKLIVAANKNGKGRMDFTRFDGAVVKEKNSYPMFVLLTPSGKPSSIVKMIAEDCSKLEVSFA